MSDMLFVCYVVAGLFAADLISATEMSYKDQGHWPKKCIEGTYQSPVALSTAVAEVSEFYPFSLRGYRQSIATILQNNGHSVTVTPKVIPKHVPKIHGGGLSEVYKFNHLHFHWQSEHTIEGKRFPLEMHMVHYASKYENFKEASKHANNGGLAVFAVLFHLSPDDVEEFNPVLNAVSDVQEHVNESKELDDFVIKDYIPIDVAGFYRYNGSLTTPGCDEGVIWTVFINTLPISQSQVDIFRAIRTDDNTPLEENYRDLQPLNNRPVLIKMSPVGYSSGHALTVTKMNIFLVLIVSLVYYFKG